MIILHFHLQRQPFKYELFYICFTTITITYEARQENKEVLDGGEKLTWTGYTFLERQVEGPCNIIIILLL